MAAVPLRPQRRLPRQFNRPVSSRTRTILNRKYARQTKHRKEKYKRMIRKSQASFARTLTLIKKWFLVVAAAVAVLFIGFILFSPVLHVREIRVARSDARLDLEKVQLILAPLFDRHMLFLSHREVRSLLEDGISDIDTISITKNYPDELKVGIELDPLVLRVVIDDPTPEPPPEELLEPLPEGEEVPAEPAKPVLTDFLTSEGVFVSSPEVPDETLPVITLTDWGVRPTPGDKILSPEFFEQMHFAEQALRQQFGHGIEKRTVFMRAKEFHLDLGGYELWFDTHSTVAEQLGRYRVFLRSVDPKVVLEYIDLRLSDRVIYK